MSEERLHFRAGERLKRGGTVVQGEGTIVFEKKEKAKTFLKAYHCPNGCKAQTSTDDDGISKASPFILWAYGPSQAGALLTSCFNCDAKLVEKPKKKRGE